MKEFYTASEILQASMAAFLAGFCFARLLSIFASKR